MSTPRNLLAFIATTVADTVYLTRDFPINFPVVACIVDGDPQIPPMLCDDKKAMVEFASVIFARSADFRCLRFIETIPRDA
jgi:hypothetical protein